MLIILFSFFSVPQICGLLFMAGMLGLEPATMKLPLTASAQITQAVDNCRAVLQTMGSDHDHVLASTFFVRATEDLAAMHQLYIQALNGKRRVRAPEPLFSIAISALPRDAAVEVQLLSWQIRLKDAFPATRSPVQTRAVGLERGVLLHHQATVVWQSMCSVQLTLSLTSPDTPIEWSSVMSDVWEEIDKFRREADMPVTSLLFFRVYHSVTAVPSAAIREGAVAAFSSEALPVMTVIPASDVHGPCGASALAMHIVFNDSTQQLSQQWIKGVRSADRVG
jgi:2-iminobutanoate/2-iminopropanoate deaminase